MQAPLVLDLAAGCGPRIRQRHRGLSTVELSLVLIGVATVMAGVYLGFSEAQRRIEVKENVQAILEITGAIRKFVKENSAPYGTLHTTVAVNMGIIPDRFRLKGTAYAANSYGGRIDVSGMGFGTTSDPYSKGKYYSLQWDGVPKSQCFDLVLGIYNSSPTINVYGAWVKFNNVPNWSIEGACERETSWNGMQIMVPAK